MCKDYKHSYVNSIVPFYILISFFHSFYLHLDKTPHKALRSILHSTQKEAVNSPENPLLQWFLAGFPARIIMGDADFIPFPGNLDPRAQEFFPRNPYTYPLPSVQFYYPYHPPPPTQYGEVLVYPQPTLPAYANVEPPLPAPCLPPQSSIPTRTVLVSMVPLDVSESLMRRELEVFGDVRAVQMERVRDGIVTVHFYDLRHAQAAVVEIHHQHMQQQYRLRCHYESGAGVALPPPVPSPAPGLIAGRAVWAQFIIPVTCSIPGGNNQGTLVLLNLDPDVSAGHLKDIFRAFGKTLKANLAQIN